VRLEGRVLAFLRGQSLARLVGLVVVSGVVMVIISLLAVAAAQPVPASWVEIASAAIAGGAPDPLNLAGPFTLVGVWVGLGIGAAWHWRKFGLPATGGSWKMRLVRYLVGGAGAALIYFGLSAVFPRTQDVVGLSLRLLRYGLLGFWVSALAPVVFKRLRLV
jgi:hypothetical protein